jgi:hypothetical protein
VKWQPFVVIVLLILVVLAAGCMDDEVPLHPESVSADPVLPGQDVILIGDVSGDGLEGGAIDTITLTIGLAPGVKALDIEAISIVYADTLKTETLIPVEGYWGDPPQAAWGILQVFNQVGTSNNRIEDREQFVIRTNPRSYLPAKRMVVIVVRPSSSTVPLTIRRFAPSTITAQGNILTPP